MEWAADMGVFNQTVDSLEDPSSRFAAQPLMSGVGRHGHTISLQRLAKLGAVLLGRLSGVQKNVVHFSDDLKDHLRFGDASSAGFRQAVDAFIDTNGIAAPPDSGDGDDRPDLELERSAAPSELNLQELGISTVIWCTGFRADFGWIDLPALDGDGLPIQESGVSILPGLYFVGIPWQRNRKSSIILGAEDDARFIADRIEERNEDPSDA